MDQTVLPTENIEDSFETKKKAGAVFVDLTAAYDTFYFITLFYFRIIRNRSFTLTTGDSKRSRLRRLRNGIPRDRSWPSPF